MDARIEDLERWMGGIARYLNWDLVCDYASTKTESPFCSRITRYSISRKFKQHHLDSNNSTGCSVDHVRIYKGQMALATNADELLCLAFSSTLKGPGAQWFHSLKPRSVSDFKQLSKQFVSQFIGILDRQQPDTQLLTITQRKGESLKEFVDRFN